MGERKNIPPPPGFEPQAIRFPIKRHTQLPPRKDRYFCLYLPILITGKKVFAYAKELLNLSKGC